MNWFIFVNTVPLEVPFEMWERTNYKVSHRYKDHRVDLYKFNTKTADDNNAFVYGPRPGYYYGDSLLCVVKDYEAAVEYIDTNEKFK